MTDTVLQAFKELLWYSIANSVLEDVRKATLNDQAFLRDVKNGREATIRLSKKHLRSVTSKVVNDMLNKQHYMVTSMKYCFKGMDVFVSLQPPLG